MPRRTAVAAVALGLLVASPATAYAADPGKDADAVIQGICSGGNRANVFGYKATHLGKGPVYKDGPGGTMTLARITAETVSTSVSGTGGVTASFAVVEAKAEISATSVTSMAWTSSHQYSRNINSNKYGNAQYGSWGHTATWERYYELPDCTKTQRRTGGVRIANTSQGFRYWETSS